jgi:hypothetical protein
MRINYLNNRDILKEIHRSKCTYSSFLTKYDSDCDYIVNELSEITPQAISQAKHNRADRIGKAAYYDHIKAHGKKDVKMSDFDIDPLTYSDTDVIFRLMTFDHIPEEPGRKKTVKSEADKHTRLNFPPFQHYRLDDEGNLNLVGKSHWKGDVHTGKFCKDHGRMTDELGRMFLKLCDRYGTRANWRGYTYNDEMRGQAIVQLAHIGLQFDEGKSQNPFAYYTAAITNSFTRVLNIEKKNQNIRDDILEMNDYNPSYTRQAAHDHAVGLARFNEAEGIDNE